jgi:hypothetical protein
MELSQTIKELCEERKRLDIVIAALEAIARPSGAEAAANAVDPGRSRRGRKSMGSEERRQVAERMRAYWAGRRNPRGDDTEPQETPSHGASTGDSVSDKPWQPNPEPNPAA